VAVADAQPVETRQKITVNGEALAYTARAGYLALRNSATGQSSAHIFFTSYTREGVGNASARPLIFFLGGAPGVAAAWQDFGGLGPKRMKWMKDGAGLPPYGWAENPYTILGQADLVFVSPVGTAYSRADQPGRAADFWTTAADTALLGGFVRGFTAAYGRRNSPLFVAGEDFGTARAAGVAGYLIERHIPVQGVILLSIAPSADSLAGDTRHLTLLPSLAMAAWWHKKLEAELQAMSAAQIAEQARQFCAREYLHALYKGDRMTPEERAKVVAALARLTGLSKAFIVSNDLRIPLERFVTELLRDQKRTLSTADARAAGFSPAGGRGGRGGGTSPAATDYNQGSLAGGFLTAYEAYLRGELNFTGPGGVFYLSGGGVGAFTSTGSDEASLASAFARNPRLRLFVGVNLYDLAAPFYAAEFTLAHLSVSPEVRAGNINTGHYEAGQMAYVDDRALAGLHRDLVRFINETMSPERQ
jgi:carboxypeptidase C (cathepsin A)